MMKQKALKRLAAIGLLGLSGGLAHAETKAGGNDPWEQPNRAMYNFNDSLDRNFFTPVAKGYVAVTPKVVRAGVTRVFENVSYLNVVFNNLLQGKFQDFASDASRFVVNSSVGLGGLFDPATKVGLPAHDEDLGQTLGKWGLGEGRYMVLPLMGPNSLRDLPNVASSMALNPLTYLNAVVTVPLGVINTINARANLLDETSIRDQAALDPYTFVREAYRQQREFKIYDGNPPTENLDEYIDSDGKAPAVDESSVLKVY